MSKKNTGLAVDVDRGTESLNDQIYLTDAGVIAALLDRRQSGQTDAGLLTYLFRGHAALQTDVPQLVAKSWT